MPKFTKAKEDEITKLIADGYTNKEVSNQTGVGVSTVSRYRNRKKSTPRFESLANTDKSTEPLAPLVSGASIRKLATLQVILGCDSIDDAVDLLSRDVPLMMSYKFRVAPDFKGTPSDVFREAVESSKILEAALDPKNRDPDAMSRLLKKLGMTWWAKGLYNLHGDKETIIQFMERILVDHFLSLGWECHNLRASDLRKLIMHNNSISKDLLLIISPDGVLHYPIVTEDYFDVLTAPFPSSIYESHALDVVKYNYKND